MCSGIEGSFRRSGLRYAPAAGARRAGAGAGGAARAARAARAAAGAARARAASGTRLLASVGCARRARGRARRAHAWPPAARRHLRATGAFPGATRRRDGPRRMRRIRADPGTFRLRRSGPRSAVSLIFRSAVGEK